MNKKKVPKTAFSLIELSVAIAVIGILIASVLVADKIIVKARISSAATLTATSGILEMSGLELWVETTLAESFIKKEIDSNIGQRISKWYSLSQDSKNSSLSQFVVGSRPIYVKQAINSLPAVKFSPSTFLSFNGSAISNSDFTIFIVEQRLSQVSNNFFLNSQSSNAFRVGYESNTNFIAISSGAAMYSRNVDSFSDYRGPRIHTIRLMANQNVEHAMISTKSGIAVSTHSTSLSIQQYFDAIIGRYDGYIGEVIIFNRVLKDDEKAKIQHYLMQKWKISDQS